MTFALFTAYLDLPLRYMVYFQLLLFKAVGGPLGYVIDIPSGRRAILCDFLVVQGTCSSCAILAVCQLAQC